MNIEYVETIAEMVQHIKENYSEEEITPSLVRGHCEIAFANGHELDSDEVMIELGIGE